MQLASAIIPIIVILTSIWVFIDAKKIGVQKGQIEGMGNLNPIGWLVACLMLWIVSFPFYLAKRGEYKRINSSKAQKATIVSTQAIASGDLLTQLDKLAQLRDRGVLTDEEFNVQKQKLLNVESISHHEPEKFTDSDEESTLKLITFFVIKAGIVISLVWFLSTVYIDYKKAGDDEAMKFAFSQYQLCMWDDSLEDAQTYCKNKHITDERLKSQLPFYWSCVDNFEGKESYEDETHGFLEDATKTCGEKTISYIFEKEQSEDISNPSLYTQAKQSIQNTAVDTSDDKFGAIYYDFIKTKDEKVAELLDSLETNSMINTSMTVKEVFAACGEYVLRDLKKTERIKLVEILKAGVNNDEEYMKKLKSTPDGQLLFTSTFLLMEDVQTCAFERI